MDWRSAGRNNEIERNWLKLLQFESETYKKLMTESFVFGQNCKIMIKISMKSLLLYLSLTNSTILTWGQRYIAVITWLIDMPYLITCTRINIKHALHRYPKLSTLWFVSLLAGLLRENWLVSTTNRCSTLCKCIFADYMHVLHKLQQKSSKQTTLLAS